jgi:hypothetical protein
MDSVEPDKAMALVTLCLLEHVRAMKRQDGTSDAASTYQQLVELVGSEQKAAHLLGSGTAFLLLSMDGKSGIFDAERALQDGLLGPSGAV